MSDASDRHDMPEWADEQLSRDLPILCAKGEGQHIEYMRSFPEQARDLAKEMAAFATSGGGRILVGVDDEGHIVGLEATQELSQRDDYLKRIQGIAHGTVDPPITPKVAFARQGSSTVLAIRVHKGSQPVYYCAQKPYIRHLTESRPARPEEVIARVLSWAGLAQSNGGIANDQKSERNWKCMLDSILVDVLIAMDEMPRLSLEPGPIYLKSVCESIADRLQEVIVDYLEHEEAVAQSLRELRQRCDDIVYTLTARSSSTWPVLEKQCPPVRILANELRESLIGTSLVNDALRCEAAEAVKKAARQLRALLERFDQMLGSSRQDDLLAEAREIAEPVLKRTYSHLAPLSEEDAEELRRAAMDLHIFPCHGQYYDCSGSEKPLRERFAKQINIIEAIAAKID
jgi:ATP-dependent DNA helicase RecG